MSRRDVYEIQVGAPWLAEQVGLIDPKLIVPLGHAATKAILDEQVPMGLVHGHLFEWQNRTVIPAFHPAAVLRNGGLRQAFRGTSR